MGKTGKRKTVIFVLRTGRPHRGKNVLDQRQSLLMLLLRRLPFSVLLSGSSRVIPCLWGFDLGVESTSRVHEQIQETRFFIILLFGLVAFLCPFFFFFFFFFRRARFLRAVCALAPDLAVMASNNNESASPTRVTIAPVITAEALAGGLSSDRQNPRGVEDKGNLDAGGERIGGADEEEEDDDVEPLDSPLPSVQGSFSFNFQTLPSDLDNMWPSSLDGYNFIGRLFATKTTEAHVAVTRVEDAAPRESTRVGDASDKPSEKPLGAVMKAAASATAAAVSVVVAAQTAQTAQAAAVKASEEAVVAAAATLSINSNLASSSSTAAPPSKPDLTASSTSNDHTESGSLNEAIAASTRAAGAAATAAEAAIATCNAAAVSTNMAGNVSNATAKHVGRFCVVRRINFERVDMSMDSFRRSALVMSPVSRGHSNVLGMFTAFADRHYLYIVQPNMNLGSLVEVMVQRQQCVC